jgi:hypothetical protein
MRAIKILLVALIGIALASCGGGGGSGSTSSTGGLSAYVADGPVSNANCVLYDPFAVTLSPITSSASVNGQVTFTGIPSSYQNYWMLVQCAGGSYFDEATGKTINLPTTQVQQSLFQYKGSSTTNVVVTPLTSIASENTLKNGGIIADYPLQLRQTAILLGLGNVDISSVQPIDVNSKSADTSIASQYGIVLAMLSEMMADKPATYPDLGTLVSTIANSITGGTLGNTVQTDIKTALTNYSNNPLNKFVSKPLIATNSPLFINLSNGNAGGTLSTQPNYASQSISPNTTGTGISYGLPITATGGTPPYHYQFDTFLNGSPPLGLSINLLTGELNGAPTVPGTYRFGVCAVDLVGASSCSQVEFVVGPTPTCSNGATNYPTCTPPTSGTYYWANWSCGSSSQCASLMGAYTGSTGPMCTINDCNSWASKYIQSSCTTTATYSKVTGSMANGVCAKSGVDF